MRSWSSLRPAVRDVEPSSLVHATPQLAKDEDYARAVQTAWLREHHLPDDMATEHSQLTYHAPHDGTPLYGHAVRRTVSANHDSSVPGILLFHTGAGPHDVSLLWKADALVSNSNVFPNGAVVLVADILSDESGWGWSADRTRYNEARRHVLMPQEDGGGTRMFLQNRIRGALDALLSLPNVDSTNLAALGWCLGGHSILELARMQTPGMKALVTFHAVFDGVPPKSSVVARNDHDAITCRLLICNGAEDPFVSAESLEAAKASFGHHGIVAEVITYPGAKHGFSNPAHDFNPNPSFQYQHEAATQSWTAALDLLRSQLD